MVDRVQDHIFDLLAADSRLLTGGFTGVKRVYAGDNGPANGYVNLFDWALEDDSREARPALYFGLRNTQAQDRIESRVISTEGMVEYHIATVPLVVVCSDINRSTAKDKRAQLAGNVRAILSDFENKVQSGYWWLLEELNSQGSFRNSGGGASGMNEARLIINYGVSYKYVAGQVIV